MERVRQQQLRHYDRGPLEVHRLPAIVLEVVDAQHGPVDEARDLGQDPLEVGEEGRVVEGPFRRALDVPLAQRQAVCDGEPVPVDLKVGGLAGGTVSGGSGISGTWSCGSFEEGTYYAGNSRILRPAAMKAHCAMEGYGSLMAASGEWRGLRRGLLMCGGPGAGRRRDVASVVILPRFRGRGVLTLWPAWGFGRYRFSALLRQGSSGIRVISRTSYCRLLPHTGNDEWTGAVSGAIR